MKPDETTRVIHLAMDRVELMLQCMHPTVAGLAGIDAYMETIKMLKELAASGQHDLARENASRLAIIHESFAEICMALSDQQ